MRWLRVIIGILPEIKDVNSELDQKAWYLSETFWAKGIILIGSAIVVFTSNDIFKPTPEEAAAIGAGITAFIGIIMRIKTKIPVGLHNIPKSNSDKRY